MPPEVGSGWIEFFPLALGMNFARGFHQFAPNMMGKIIPFIDVTGDLTEPTLIISEARIGRVILKDRCVDTDFIFGQGFTLFQHVDRLDYLPMLDASSDIEVTMLKIGDSMLTQLLGESHAYDMLKALGVLEVPSAAVCAVPRHISVFLHESLTNHLSGMMRKLYAQTKALNYVSALVGHLIVEGERDHQPSLKQKLVFQLHEELSCLQGKVPTLDELAKNYGMSARVLNNEFNKCYGMTIYKFISELRLAEAHKALLDTNIPLKVLALKMGYSHVNHFISAFGKKFGYSPGKLRLKGRN